MQQPQIHQALLNFVRPTPHSKFSPSSVERWLGCAFSVAAIEGIPEETSKYAEEGTLAHSVAEAMFRHIFFGVPFPAELSIQMAMQADGGMEMEECARAYAEVIIFWMNNKEAIGDIVWYGLEKGIPVYPEEGCFGTADCLIIGTKGCAVIDFKYGKGKNVAANSLQLKVYAAGVAKHLMNIPKEYKFFSIVHQPRTDMAPKEHAYTSEELYGFLKVIWQAIEDSKAKGLSPVEGNHCFWCPAKRTKDREKMCPIVFEKPLKLAQENFGKFLADMNGPSLTTTFSDTARDQAIIKLRALFPLLKDVMEKSEEEFLFRLSQGEVIPGVRIVESMGNRVINAETDEEKIRLITEKFPGIVATKTIPATTKVRTITELEKELGKNKLDSICVRKVTKKVDIMDEKMRDILGEMSAYGKMINNGNSQGE